MQGYAFKTIIFIITFLSTSGLSMAANCMSCHQGEPLAVLSQDSIVKNQNRHAKHKPIPSKKVIGQG